MHGGNLVETLALLITGDPSSLCEEFFFFFSFTFKANVQRNVTYGNMACTIT